MVRCRLRHHPTHHQTSAMHSTSNQEIGMWRRRLECRSGCGKSRAGCRRAASRSDWSWPDASARRSRTSLQRHWVSAHTEFERKPTSWLTLRPDVSRLQVQVGAVQVGAPALLEKSAQRASTACRPATRSGVCRQTEKRPSDLMPSFARNGSQWGSSSARRSRSAASRIPATSSAAFDREVVTDV